MSYFLHSQGISMKLVFTLEWFCWLFCLLSKFLFTIFTLLCSSFTIFTSLCNHSLRLWIILHLCVIILLQWVIITRIQRKGPAQRMTGIPDLRNSCENLLHFFSLELEISFYMSGTRVVKAWDSRSRIKVWNWKKKFLFSSRTQD